MEEHGDDVMAAKRRQYESYELDDDDSEPNMRRKRRANMQAVSNLGNLGGSGKDLDIVATFCGRDYLSARLFGVLFPRRSYPLDASNFLQMDSTHWVLDMSIFIGETYDQVKDVCVFLIDKFSIPPEKALALYVQSPGSHFQYCGAVCQACPSAVLSLLWPNVGGQRQLLSSDSTPLSAKIGLVVEDRVSLPTLNVGKQRQLELLALKVGENLLSFLQLSSPSDNLRSSLDVFNRWFKKFQEKLTRDSEYTKSLLFRD